MKPAKPSPKMKFQTERPRFRHGLAKGTIAKLKTTARCAPTHKMWRGEEGRRREPPPEKTRFKRARPREAPHPGRQALKQDSGKASQAQRSVSCADRFRAGHGSSTKQPPAMPVASGRKPNDFQYSVVPQRAQKWRL